VCRVPAPVHRPGAADCPGLPSRITCRVYRGVEGVVRRQGLGVVVSHVQAGLGVGTCEDYARRSLPPMDVGCMNGPLLASSGRVQLWPEGKDWLGRPPTQL
jgi:hypothetical protein